MSKTVEFPEDEEITEKLDTLRIGGEEFKIHKGKRGAEYIIKGGKKQYLSDAKYQQEYRRKKKAGLPTARKPSKFVASKYSDHPITNIVKSMMSFNNILINSTVLKNRKTKLTSKDVENSQMGEAITYCADYYGLLGGASSPILILLSSMGGYMGRIGVLYMSGKTEKAGELADGQLGMKK